MATWRPRTLADVIVERSASIAPQGGMRLMGIAQEAPPPPELRQRVECRCGRREWPFAMVNVEGLAEAVRGDATHLCCGCWTALIRRGIITEAAFAEALGAPPEVVQRAQGGGDSHVE